MVDQHDVAIQYVGAGDGEPPFGYTVGLYRASHPEFIMFGLPPELTQALLNDLAFSVLRAGMRFEPGDLVEHLLQNYPVLLVEVDDPADHLMAALTIRAHRGDGELPVAALQVLLPDRAGHFVGHEDYTDAESPLLGQVLDGGSLKFLPDAESRRSQGW